MSVTKRSLLLVDWVRASGFELQARARLPLLYEQSINIYAHNMTETYNPLHLRYDLKTLR